MGAGISDYLEPVITPEYAAMMVDQVRQYLGATSNWDVCHWQDLSSDTPWRALASEVTEDAQCMEIPLKGRFDAYWESCGRGLRQNVRRDRTKAESRGKLRFDVTKEADPELLNGLIEMHRERWQRKNESGMIEANRSADFLREIARDFAAQGLLRIFSLRFEEEGSQLVLGSSRAAISARLTAELPREALPAFTEEKLVAVILAFSYQGRMSNYLTGFDPAYERLGFGRTLLFEALRYCFENKYEVWDFLRGDEPYKKLWRAEIVRKTRIVVNRTA
jgi:CelD/BcsL family acetyltransferase involved in cellulose biosynthesis